MDKMLLAGATTEGDFLMGLCRVRAPGVTVGISPRLAVMNATTTAPLTFDGLTVPSNDVVMRTNASEMSLADMHSTVFQAARSLGVARAAARHLPSTAAEHLVVRVEAQHDKMNAWDNSPSWPRATALRKEALELASLAVKTAFVCAGGQAHTLGHPVQRLAREASFYATTQLTAELRESYLSQLEY
jgi:alkylation response protein AidB-like acyl-CoA dehydrogenase